MLARIRAKMYYYLVSFGPIHYSDFFSVSLLYLADVYMFPI